MFECKMDLQFKILNIQYFTAKTRCANIVKAENPFNRINTLYFF